MTPAPRSLIVAKLFLGLPIASAVASELPPTWLPEPVKPLWAVFDAAGPIANFFQIVPPLLSLLLLAGGLLVGRRLRNKSARIARLERDKARMDHELEDLEQAKAELAAKVAELQSQTAEAALARSSKEWNDGNGALHHQALAAWLTFEGPAISKLLLRLSRWALSQAVGETRSDALLVAQTYASSAACLDPTHHLASRVAADIALLRREEGQAGKAFPAALDAMQAQAPAEQVKEEEVLSALASLKDVGPLIQVGRYGAALMTLEFAEHRLALNLGLSAKPTLDAGSLHAHVLHLLGQNDAALSLSQDVAARQAANPQIGPSDMGTLRSQFTQAESLRELGRPLEALAILEEAQSNNESRRDAEPHDTLSMQLKKATADIFLELGRPDQAVAILQDLVEYGQTSAALSASSPQTAAAKLMLGSALQKSQRYDEALAVVESLPGIKDQGFLTGAQRGEALNFALNALQLKASLMVDLGRHADALPIAERIVTHRNSSEAFGPSHPYSLSARHLRAEVLQHLGRCEDALVEIRQVIVARTQHSSLGPSHPETLTSRRVEAETLWDLGQRDEALAVIQDVAKCRAKDAARGPLHPETLSARSVEAQFLTILDRFTDAYAVIDDVVAKQYAHPAMGPWHPDTLGSQYLKAAVLSLLGERPAAIAHLRSVLEDAHAHLGSGHERLRVLEDALASYSKV